MSSSKELTEDERNIVDKAIVFALSKRLSFDPTTFSDESIRGCDVGSLFLNVVEKSEHSCPFPNKDEIMKWVTFASSVPSETDACFAKLSYLNDDLNQKSVLLGGGLKPSEADIVVFAALHSCCHLTDNDLQKFPNVLRWMDYIQSMVDFGGILKKIVVNKPEFDFKKVSIDSKSSEGLTKSKAATQEKKKASEKLSNEKDTECTVSILNIQIGVIRKAWKHPSADSLLVEEIDLGEGNLRQVVSGLAKFYKPEDLFNRRVVLITNVKPGKLRDEMSAGLVLCASNQDHTIVEPLVPPEGAFLGERVSFSGYDGKPEDVLNPKKKQLEKITPHLYTDDKGVATFKGIPFMTSAGPCTSSIPNATVK